MPISGWSGQLRRATAVAIGLSVSVAAQAAPDVSRYVAACDGSAAVALGYDEFANADDDFNILRVYRIGRTDPVQSLNLDAFLDAPPKRERGFKEADLEGAARVGDRIYWIGSHGRNSEGHAEPGRARFFATRIVAGQDGHRLEAIGPGAYTGMREALLADPKLASLGLREAYAPDKETGGPPPESANGFNIEGLAATADGRLLIGFRNPRPRGSALLIPLQNPAEVVEKGSTPIFGTPVLLDLGGRGIRSIDRVGDRYLIIGGPHGPASASTLKLPFALFAWSDGARDAEAIEGLRMPDDFSPEALFVSDDGARLRLLSDDGDRAGCKHAPSSEKAFRVLDVAAPHGHAPIRIGP